MTDKLEFVDLKSQYAALKGGVAQRMQRVLDHGQYIMGPEVGELETKLARYTGAKHCVTVASGTEALLIALMALGLKLGDEVVTTPFTFAATAEMIVLLGGVPVFADIEPDTCNIDASKIEAKITERTRAIMPVSLYGQCADMTAINTIAARHGLPVIEDAAQSFGAGYGIGHGSVGRKSCNLSTIGCTSFFPSKPLGCYGDGGALFTNDDALAQAAREIRVHGQSARYTHTSGVSSGTPGETTIKSCRRNVSSPWPPLSTMIPASSSVGISRASAAADRVSLTVTRAPRALRNSAAAIPLLPNPTTSTRLFFKSIIANSSLDCCSYYSVLPHRSFNVVNANSANTSARIQNRAITFDSDHPINSK